MAGQSVISHDVLASYAADAARETPGVGRLVDGPRRHRGVRVTEDEGAFTLEVHVAVEWGSRADDVGAAVQQRVFDYVTTHGQARDVLGGRRRRGRRGRRGAMSVGVTGLTRATVSSAPAVCRSCVWWQSRGNRTASKDRWMERAEEDWGEWGTLYLDDGGRLLGSLQYGPPHLFPRAADLPAGPVSDDAVVVTCSYVVGDGAEWIEKSLLLAAIGESRDRGAKALEAFAYRYPEGESVEERFLVHRTVFPRDFLEEFGFVTLRAPGSRGALPARARRSRAGRGGDQREGAPRGTGGVHAVAGARAAARSGSARRCGVVVQPGDLEGSAGAKVGPRPEPLGRRTSRSTSAGSTPPPVHSRANARGLAEVRRGEARLVATLEERVRQHVTRDRVHRRRTVAEPVPSARAGERGDEARVEQRRLDAATSERRPSVACVTASVRARAAWATARSKRTGSSAEPRPVRRNRRAASGRSQGGGLSRRRRAITRRRAIEGARPPPRARLTERGRRRRASASFNRVQRWPESSSSPPSPTRSVPPDARSQERRQPWLFAGIERSAATSSARAIGPDEVELVVDLARPSRWFDTPR